VASCKNRQLNHHLPVEGGARSHTRTRSINAAYNKNNNNDNNNMCMGVRNLISYYRV